MDTVRVGQFAMLQAVVKVLFVFFWTVKLRYLLLYTQYRL